MPEKMVFVVGAGASAEADLPFGQAFMSRIGEQLNIHLDSSFSVSTGSELIVEAIRTKVGPIDLHLPAALQIRDGMRGLVSSIDTFLDMHQGNEDIALCAKLAIVQVILEAERDSRLAIDKTTSPATIDFSNLSGTWYTAFLRLLEGPKDSLTERLQSISLVVFNYDRCIEEFLYESLQRAYRLGTAEAADLVMGMKIYHPYGTVGSLPWMKRENSIDFGEEPNATQLFNLATQIRTFTEGTDPDSSDIEQIQYQVSEAGVIIFLGFAYHTMNLELLTPRGGSRAHKLFCYGTAAGLSNNDCDVVRTDLEPLKQTRSMNTSVSNDYDCTGLFKEFGRVWFNKLNG